MSACDTSANEAGQPTSTDGSSMATQSRHLAASVLLPPLSAVVFFASCDPAVASSTTHVNDHPDAAVCVDAHVPAVAAHVFAAGRSHDLAVFSHDDCTGHMHLAATLDDVDWCAAGVGNALAPQDEEEHAHGRSAGQETSSLSLHDTGARSVLLPRAAVAVVLERSRCGEPWQWAGHAPRDAVLRNKRAHPACVPLPKRMGKASYLLTAPLNHDVWPLEKAVVADAFVRSDAPNTAFTALPHLAVGDEGPSAAAKAILGFGPLDREWLVSVGLPEFRVVQATLHASVPTWPCYKGSGSRGPTRPLLFCLSLSICDFCCCCC